MNDVDLSRASTMSRTSLILGICAIIPFVGGALGLAALILGIIDLVKIKNKEAGQPGKKFDITGIVLGVILPCISVIIMFVIVGATVWSTFLNFSNLTY